MCCVSLVGYTVDDWFTLTSLLSVIVILSEVLLKPVFKPEILLLLASLKFYSVQSDYIMIPETLN